MPLLTRKLLSRGIFCNFFGKGFVGPSLPVKYFSSSSNPRNTISPTVKILATSIPFLGCGYVLYSFRQKDTEFGIVTDMLNNRTPYPFLVEKPKAPIARRIPAARDDINLELTLFQYPTCPFCCKVRAFLDYYGLPYEVVEVNPIIRSEIHWSKYKKVPIVIAKVDGGYQQLNDSSIIISVLWSYLLKSKSNLKDIVEYYPVIKSGNKHDLDQMDVVNKYRLMFQDVPLDRPVEKIQEEEKWRKWADSSLVHVLSPNVYRTYSEAKEAFTWFSEVGEWEKIFPAWQVTTIIHIGTFVMWIISKLLKKRHNLMEDERQSLYQEVNKWLRAVQDKSTTYMGGDSPNLADLTVYGMLTSIEGCLAFNDLLQNTKIKQWYYPMKEAVNNRRGKHEIGE